MQDVFIEYMVKKVRPPIWVLLKIAIVLGAVLLFVLFFILAPFLQAFSMVAILLAFGSVYGAYRLITGMSVEFEYAFTNGEMDIDQIVAQRKRKRLVSVKCREIDDFGRYKASEHENKNYSQKIFACDYPTNEDLWFFAFHHREKGNTLVVFNTSEKMLNSIKMYIPSPIMHRVFRIGA